MFKPIASITNEQEREQQNERFFHYLCDTPSIPRVPFALKPISMPLVLKPIPVPETAKEPASLPRIEEPKEEAAPVAVPGLLQLTFEPIEVPSESSPEPIKPRNIKPIIRNKKQEHEYLREKNRRENRKYMNEDELKEFLKLKQVYGSDYKRMGQILKKDFWTLKALDNLYRQGLLKIK